MSDVKTLLEKLENDGRLDKETVVRLNKEGYIEARILKDNDGSIASAVIAGLTKKGNRVLNNEN
jgi:hypothetical protein